VNKHNICRLFKKVHDDWMASISDPEVRAAVKTDTIISGGSIASLLLNEKVNDFDVYFTNFETTRKVAEYYIKRFIELNPDTRIKPKLAEKDLETKRVKIYIKSIGFCSEKGDAGYQYFESLPDGEGEDFVDRAMAGDDDIEGDSGILGDGSGVGGSSQEIYQNIIADADETDSAKLESEAVPDPLFAQKQKFRPVFMTSNAITLADNIQIVTRFYGSPDEIHANYDFTHCTNYWTSENGNLVLRPDAMEALLARELRYQGSKYPLCSVIRTRKFLRRNWIINAGQYLKMCFQLSELNLKDPVVLEDQLTGVDTAYFMQLIERCKSDLKKDPATQINSAYIVSLVDRMF
jgi:hypothetical protein